MSRITEARNSLILGQPFFGALSLRLAVAADPAVATMAVDGKTLSYNPEWVEALPFDQLVGVTAHEVMHCAAAHHARRGGRALKRWNKACDYAVNPLLVEAGFTLPPGALNRPDFAGLSAEEIYTRLACEDPGGDSAAAGQDRAGGAAGAGAAGEPGDIGGCGSFTDGPGDGVPATEAELSEQAREWEIATMQAAAAAKGAGQLPGAGDWLTRQITRPKISWEEVLREFVTQRATTEYSWARPNRRFIHQGLYLPSRESKRLGEIVVVVDSSGSTWGPMLDAFAAEFNGIVEDMRPERTHVVYWDTRLQGHETFEAEDGPITMAAKGGGGTVFAGVWPWLDQAGLDPECVVFFTDLVCSRFGTEPAYPVLWCSTLKTAAPFGEVVKLTLNR